MRMHVLHCKPHRAEQSFTSAGVSREQVYVSEWDLLTPAAAEQVMAVELPVQEYQRSVARARGSEPDAQRAIVREARRRMERGTLHHLTAPFPRT